MYQVVYTRLDTNGSRSGLCCFDLLAVPRGCLSPNNRTTPSPTPKDFRLLFPSAVVHRRLMINMSCVQATKAATPTAVRSRTMTVVSSPLCVAVAPYTRPVLNAPWHTLRRPALAFEAVSRGGASARFRDFALTSAPLAPPSRSPSPSSRPGLVIANSLRGGCATGSVEDQHGRARRPLQRFFAPALVW